jgi:uncharacterized protein (DUF697 family)/GTP-binding protein EngB required for normal cell division
MSTFPINNIEEELKKQLSEIQKPNLLVVGGTGVGKSSLINRVFGSEVAKTGEGKAVTRGLNRHDSPDLPITFYDSEGYEIAKDGTENRTNFEINILPEIKRMNSGELKDHIHLVWYCISIANHRVSGFDLKNISDFVLNNMKIAIVATQGDLDDELPDGKGKDAAEFKRVIDQSSPGLPFFETCATKEDVALDLGALLEWSAAALPEGQLRQSFAAAQIASIEGKKREAYAAVKIATSMAGASGALNPLPISDSLVIVPQQLTMCAKIAYIFWGNARFFGVINDLLKTQILTLAGRQIAASLVKLIPGFGHVVNGVVAASFTFGLGAAVVEANASAFKTLMETGQMPNWAEIFTSKAFLDLLASINDDFHQ